MTKKKLKHFEKLLLSEKEKILLKINAGKEVFDELQKNEIGDLVDKAFNMWELDRAIDISEQDKKNLIEINKALLRIKNEVYGVCACKKEIEDIRLEAIPWTEICLSCIKKLKFIK